MKVRRNDEGAVLLTTLLVMTLMATLAVSLTDDARFAAKRASITASAAQARHYLDGAEVFALSFIDTAIEENGLEGLNGYLIAGSDTVFPIDGGLITLAITDATNCISPLDATGGESERVTRLFEIAGVPTMDAQTLTARLKDWQDAEQSLSVGGAEDGVYLGANPAYRTADTPVTAVSELRAVQGFDPETYALVAPYLCVRPADGPININTLRPQDAPILAAQKAITPQAALDLISQRPLGGWSDISEFVEGEDDAADDDMSLFEEDLSIDALPGDEPEADPAAVRYVTEPQILDVVFRVDYRGQTRFGRAQVDLSGKPAVLSRQRGEAAIAMPRPLPESAS